MRMRLEFPTRKGATNVRALEGRGFGVKERILFGSLLIAGIVFGFLVQCPTIAYASTCYCNGPCDSAPMECHYDPISDLAEEHYTLAPGYGSPTLSGGSRLAAYCDSYRWCHGNFLCNEYVFNSGLTAALACL